MGKEQSINHESKKFYQVSIKTSDNQMKSASLKIKGDIGSGGSGCEGSLTPAEINIDGQKTLIQLKQFYKESYDDQHGEFSQDPPLKVKESFQALKELQELGFKIVPFFGIVEFSNKITALAVTDLSNGGKLEVHDEKYFIRDKKVVASINNNQDIKLGFFKTKILSKAHGIHFGFLGTASCHMITLNPSTHKADIFISDVGEFEKQIEKTKYRQVFENTNIFNVSEDELFKVYQQILIKQNKNIDAKETFDSYLKNNSQKKEFQDIFYKLATGSSLDNFNTDNVKFIKKRFTKNNFLDNFFIIKDNLYNVENYFKEIAGYDLFDDSNNLIDLAYKVLIDSKINFLINARNLIDNDIEIPEFTPIVNFNKNALPKLEFFDTKKEIKNPIFSGEVLPNIKSGQFNKCKISVKVDYDQKSELNHCRQTLLLPEQIKTIKIDSLPIINVDPEKIFILPLTGFDSDNINRNLPLAIDGIIYYFYKSDNQFWYLFNYNLKNQKEISKLEGCKNLILGFNQLSDEDTLPLFKAFWSERY